MRTDAINYFSRQTDIWREVALQIKTPGITDIFLPLIDAAEQITAARDDGKKIVQASGTFTLPHFGHDHYFAEAKQKGDYLIVTMNNPDSLEKIGRCNGFVPFYGRIISIASNRNVDALVIFEEETPEELIRVISPNIYVKGIDWKDTYLPEREFVESYGGKIKFIGDPYKFHAKDLSKNIRLHEKECQGCGRLEKLITEKS